MPEKNGTVVLGVGENSQPISFMIIMWCFVSEKGSFKERHEAVTDEGVWRY